MHPFHLESITAGEDCAVLRIEGDIDAYAAPQLRDRVIDLAGNGTVHIIADLRGAGFLDSAGVGALVGSRNELRAGGGSLTLVAGTGRILQTFRIAGLVNPTVVVPLGAKVTVEFINADKDQAHGWVITSTQPPFAFRQATPPALNGASAAVIGDPTAAGQGARMIAFVAGTKGTYHYLCPMPGHAQMGMAGILIVE